VRRERLRGNAGDELEGHALRQLKIATALALREGREAVTEEDSYLAGIVGQVSDATRQKVIATLNRAKTQQDLAQAHAEAEREVIKTSRLDEVASGSGGRSCESWPQRPTDSHRPRAHRRAHPPADTQPSHRRPGATSSASWAVRGVCMADGHPAVGPANPDGIS
jgi:hypothetical protein